RADLVDADLVFRRNLALLPLELFARLQPDDGDLVARLAEGVVRLLKFRVFVVSVEYACYPHADTSLNGFCDTKGSSLRGRAADRQAGARRPLSGRDRSGRRGVARSRRVGLAP